jgi:hypothetical protein
MYYNLKIEDVYRQEIKNVSFDTTEYDDWFGEVRTRTDRFEVVRVVNSAGVTHRISCNTKSEVDGVKTKVEVLGDRFDEYEEWDVNLLDTPTGQYILSQIKDWKI